MPSSLPPGAFHTPRLNGWTPEHVETLCTLYGQGATWPEITQALHRTQGACQTKLRDLINQAHASAVTAKQQRHEQQHARKELFGLLMAKGFSVNEIAQRMGLHKEAVRTARDRYLKPSVRSL